MTLEAGVIVEGRLHGACAAWLFYSVQTGVAYRGLKAGGDSMSTRKDRVNSSSSSAGKSARRRTASSVEAVELEPLDFDNAEAREKLRRASNLKGTPLARKSRAKRISRAQLIKKIGPNAIFGNMELWGQNFSKLTAIATEPCEVAFLDKRGAEVLFDSSSELCH
jgi:hypothetical protein